MRGMRLVTRWVLCVTTLRKIPRKNWRVEPNPAQADERRESHSGQAPLGRIERALLPVKPIVVARELRQCCAMAAQSRNFCILLFPAHRALMMRQILAIGSAGAMGSGHI